MAEEAYRWSLAHPSAAASRYETRRSPATFYQDLLNPDALPAYRALLDESPVADLVGYLWQSSDVWFMYEQVFLKLVSGERLRVGNDIYRPVGMKGWYHAVFRRDSDGEERLLSIDQLLRKMNDWI